MALFHRTGAQQLEQYRRDTGRSGRVLAAATGPRSVALAFPDRFAVRVGDEPWAEVGWHEVRSGGWRADSDEMYWRLVDGRRDAVQFTEPGSFPTVFRERVQASIALEQQFPVETGGAVLVSARRDLARTDPELVWHVQAVQGARLDDPAVRRLAEAAEAQLRSDYDF